jgi:hypothetical protein
LFLFSATTLKDIQEKDKELEKEIKARKLAERKAKKIAKHKNQGYYMTSKSLEFSRFPYSDKDKETQLQLFTELFPDFKQGNPCILGLNELSKIESHAFETILELFSKTNYKGNLEGDYLNVTGLHGTEKIFSPKLRIPLQEYLVNCDILAQKGKKAAEYREALSKLSDSNFFMYWRIKDDDKKYKFYARKDSLIKLSIIADEHDKRQIDLILELTPIALYLERNYVCKPVGFINQINEINPYSSSTEYNFVNYILLQAYCKKTKAKTRLKLLLNTIIKVVNLEEEAKKQGLKYVTDKIIKYSENTKGLNFLVDYEINPDKDECIFIIDKSKITEV